MNWTGGVAVIVALLATIVPATYANIDLELRPMIRTTCVGLDVQLGLYAVSDDPNAPQNLSAMDVIIAWDPAYLQLLGNVDPGTPTWFVSTFIIPDPYGLNEANPPQDGDGIYTALAPLGTAVDATPEGTLITTFEFVALAEVSGTLVELLDSAGNPLGHTRVFSGDEPNLIVTGTLSGSSVDIVLITCPGDLDHDGEVTLSDLALLLSNYGTSAGATPDEGDMDCDGDVDLADLAALLSVYGTTCN
jgi:hypothetical protein